MGKKSQCFEKPLSDALLKEKQKLITAYSSWWQSTNFVRGWSSPPFLVEDVKHLLDQVAEIVVRIRAFARTKHEIKAEPIEGAAVEWLWTVTAKPHTPAEEKAFVDDMVHATFTLGGVAERTDGSIYVAPLDEHLVNNYIHKIRSLKERASSEEKAVIQLKGEWEALQLLMDESWPVLLREVSSHPDYLCKIRDMNAFLSNLSAHEQPPVTGDAPLSKEEPKAAEETGATGEAGADGKMPSSVLSEEEQSDESHDEGGASSSSDSGERARMKASIDRHALPSDKVIVQIEKISQDAASAERDVHDLEADPTLSTDVKGMDPKEARLLVERMQKKALTAAWKLEKSLLELDSLTEVTESARPKRKEEVVKIQGALRNLDSLSRKLKEMHASLVTEHEQEHSNEKEREQANNYEEVEAPREPDIKKSKDDVESKFSQSAAVPARVATPPQAAQAETGGPVVHVPKAPARVPQDRDELLLKKFAQLQLQPRFDVKEIRDGSYVISSYVPGLGDSLKVTLSDNQDVLTITGLRLPSKEELDAMRKQVALMKQRNALSRMYAGGVPDEDELILRSFGGKYGRIEQSYRVPPHVDISAATAQYERGAIEVVLPGNRPTYAMPQRMRHPQQAYPRGYW